MKSHDAIRLSTLRMLSSAFNYAKIDNKHELTEEEELVVIKKEAKQRRDSIEAYNKAGSNDLAEKEGAELKILQEFLPPEMSDEELTQLVSDSINQLGATTIAHLGKIIGLVKSKATDVDGGRISEIVRQKLVVND